MEENKSQLLYDAMYGGIFIGLFWSFKYLFVIFDTGIPAVSFIGSLLALGTPLLLFHYLVKYNNTHVEGSMRYWHGVQFSIMLFFFASILEALIVFVHVKWIDPTFISFIYANMIEMAQSMELGKALTEQMEEQSLPSPFTYIFNSVILLDVLVGLLLSLFIVPLAIRYKPLQKI